MREWRRVGQFDCGSFADLGSELLGQPVDVIGKDGGFMAGAGNGDVTEARTEQVGMDTGVGVNEDTFGGESLRTVAGDRVAVIEVPVFGGIEFDSAVVVQPGCNPAIGRDRFNRGKIAVGDTEGFVRCGELNAVAVDPSANLLTVEKQSDELATYDPRRLSGVSVYREVVHEFSVGDRIQFTAPDKSLGVANRDLAMIESIASDGRIAVRIDDNRRIEFNAAEHRHFDHGYAVTSHSSQGLTAERVLIHADTSVHPDLLSLRFGYVAVSRASHEVSIFTDDVNRLAHQLGTEVNKTSAVELTHAPPLTHGLVL